MGTKEERLDKLKDARDKCAEVYEEEATDDLIDNGNLTTLNSAIISIENAIQIIEKRAG